MGRKPVPASKRAVARSITLPPKMLRYLEERAKEVEDETGAKSSVSAEIQKLVRAAMVEERAG